MKLKIWHKMIIGITIPSLIAIAGAILTYEYVNDIKHKQAIVQVADDLKENVLEIRRNEKNFLHFKNVEQIKNLDNAISAFSDFNEKIPLETFKQIGIEEINTLKKSTHNYSELIAKLGDNFDKESKITDRVRKEGRKLESIVAKKKLAKEISTSFILRLRLLEKNYMLFRDEKSYRSLSKTLSQITNVTPFCYDCAPYIGLVQDLMSVYKESDILAENLQQTGDGMEKITVILSGLEREKIRAFITSTQKMLLIGVLLLCVLGPFFVYTTASYISAPIKRLAEITRRISEGDISLRAPLKEHDETFTLADSFNTMLDNLQETQQSLKESLNLLNEKQAQLVESEKRASMGFLVAGIAHELNNPLNNITLRATIIKEELKDFPNEKLVEFTEDIITQSSRAHQIINNLLDFARTRKSSDMEKQDVGSIIESSVNLVHNQFLVSKIKINKHLPDEPCFVNGNRSKLEQVLVSIISNAFQAMPDTGTLTISAEHDHETNSVDIIISDTGTGISEENIKNIFQPFFTTKPSSEGGTGLGLAISNTLVKEHNGEINVVSKEGEGTEFIITIPSYEETAKVEEVAEE